MANILIADDSAMARTVIRRCLEIAGFSDAVFFEAGDGKAALEVLQKNQINLLITDLNMPELDGTGLLKRIKASPRLTSIPVIVITSISNPARIQELKELGASEVMQKPISPASIARAMEIMREAENA